MVPFFAKTNGNHETLAGWVAFRNQAQTDVDGAGLLWFLDANALGNNEYTTGWPTGIQVDYAGSKFVQSGKSGKTTIGNTGVVAPAVNGQLQLSGDGLTTILTNNLSIAVNSDIAVLGAPAGATAATGVNMSFDNGGGKLNGHFKYPATGQDTNFFGVVLQKAKSAQGFWLSPKTTVQSAVLSISAQ